MLRVCDISQMLHATTVHLTREHWEQGDGEKEENCPFTRFKRHNFILGWKMHLEYLQGVDGFPLLFVSRVSGALQKN